MTPSRFSCSARVACMNWAHMGNERHAAPNGLARRGSRPNFRCISTSIQINSGKADVHTNLERYCRQLQIYSSAGANVKISWSFGRESQSRSHTSREAVVVILD